MDETSKFRTLTGPYRLVERILLMLIPIAGIIYILNVSGIINYALADRQYLGAFVGLVLAATFFIVVPTKSARHDTVPWFDIILALVGLVIGFYLTVFYEDILMTLGQPPSERLILAWACVLLVLEATRRVSGWILVVVGAVFIIYAAYANLVPGPLAGTPSDWNVLVNYLYVDTNGLLGLPVAVTATTVMAFVFFGGILNATGSGEFFTNLATAAFGRYRGGAAKGAVGASALFGMISGSAVSNVVMVGTFTIPLMQKTGYRDHVAGAIESVGSTGGQLMPPVMGAAAFLIAQFLSRPYRDIAIAAAFPAILYYICLYVQVDLEAAKYGLKGQDPGLLPKLRIVLRRAWTFVIPFGGLLWALFFAGIPEAKAGIYAGFVGIAVALIQAQYRQKNLKWLLKSLEMTGRVCLDIGVVVCTAGFIVGAMQISGLSFILSNALINLAGGSVPILLILTAVVAVILGMGMPTTAVYVLLAVLVAPALEQMGVVPLAAHLFVFYFGMLSMVTPPVAMAAFAAAAIARTSFWKTGYEAMRLAGVAYIIPFMFVASPALLLQGSPMQVIPTCITAIIGTALLGMALTGYFVRIIPVALRVVIAICGICLVLPTDIGIAGISNIGLILNIAGFVVAFLILVFEWLRRPKPVAVQPAQ